VKIRSVVANNHKKAFEVRAGRRILSYPYAKATPRPTMRDAVLKISVAEELAREAFDFVLASGREGTVHLEQVLEYNQDPTFVHELLLYNLTLAAQRRLAATPLSKREIIRRLGTSASQFYRLLDQTNYRKSVDALLALLRVLDCEVEVSVHAKSA